MAGSALDEICRTGRFIPVPGGYYVHPLSMHHSVDLRALAEAFSRAKSSTDESSKQGSKSTLQHPNITRMYLPVGLGEDASGDIDMYVTGEREQLVLVPLGLLSIPELYRLADSEQLPVQVPEGQAPPRSVGVDVAGRLATGANVVSRWILPQALVAARESVQWLLNETATGSWQRVAQWLTAVREIRDRLGVGGSDSVSPRSWPTSAAYAAGLYIARYGLGNPAILARLLSFALPVGWGDLVGRHWNTAVQREPAELVSWLSTRPGAGVLAHTASGGAFWLFNDGAGTSPVRWLRPALDGRAADLRVQGTWLEALTALGPVEAVTVDAMGTPRAFGDVPASLGGLTAPDTPNATAVTGMFPTVARPIAVAAGLPAGATALPAVAKTVKRLFIDPAHRADIDASNAFSAADGHYAPVGHYHLLPRPAELAASIANDPDYAPHQPVDLGVCELPSGYVDELSQHLRGSVLKHTPVWAWTTATGETFASEPAGHHRDGRPKPLLPPNGIWQVTYTPEATAAEPHPVTTTNPDPSGSAFLNGTDPSRPVDPDVLQRAHPWARWGYPYPTRPMVTEPGAQKQLAVARKAYERGLAAKLVAGPADIGWSADHAQTIIGRVIARAAGPSSPPSPVTEPLFDGGADSAGWRMLFGALSAVAAQGRATAQALGVDSDVLQQLVDTAGSPIRPRVKAALERAGVPGQEFRDGLFSADILVTMWAIRNHPEVALPDIERLAPVVSWPAVRIAAALRALGLAEADSNNLVGSLAASQLNGQPSTPLYRTAVSVDIGGAPLHDIPAARLSGPEELYQRLILAGIAPGTDHREHTPYEQLYWNKLHNVDDPFPNIDQRERELVTVRYKQLRLFAADPNSAELDNDLRTAATEWQTRTGMTVRELLTKVSPAQVAAIALYTGSNYTLVNAVLQQPGSDDPPLTSDRLTGKLLRALDAYLDNPDEVFQPSFALTDFVLEHMLRRFDSTWHRADRRDELTILRRQIHARIAAVADRLFVEMRSHADMAMSALRMQSPVSGYWTYRTEEDDSEYVVGYEFSLPTIRSASREEAQAMIFMPQGEPGMLVRYWVGGYGGRDLDILSNNVTEAEIQLQAASRFRVTDTQHASAESIGDYRVVSATEIKPIGFDHNDPTGWPSAPAHGLTYLDAMQHDAMQVDEMQVDESSPALGPAERAYRITPVHAKTVKRMLVYADADVRAAEAILPIAGHYTIIASERKLPPPIEHAATIRNDPDYTPGQPIDIISGNVAHQQLSQLSLHLPGSPIKVSANVAFSTSDGSVFSSVVGRPVPNQDRRPILPPNGHWVIYYTPLPTAADPNPIPIVGSDGTSAFFNTASPTRPSETAMADAHNWAGAAHGPGGLLPFAGGSAGLLAGAPELFPTSPALDGPKQFLAGVPGGKARANPTAAPPDWLTEFVPPAGARVKAGVVVVGSGRVGRRVWDVLRQAQSWLDRPLVVVTGGSGADSATLVIERLGWVTGIAPLALVLAGVREGSALTGSNVVRVQGVGGAVGENWEVVSADELVVGRFAGPLRDDVFRTADAEGARAVARLPQALAALLQARSRGSAAQLFARYRQSLVGDDVLAALDRVVAAAPQDPWRSTVRLAVEIERAVGGNGIRPKPAAAEVWDAEAIPSGPVGGVFAFDYLGLPGSRAQRLVWDGLLLWAWLGKRLGPEHAVRLADLVGGADGAANAAVLRAVITVVSLGQAGLHDAVSLIRADECRLHPDDKFGWIVRLEHVSTWLRQLDQAEHGQALDRFNDALADCP